MKILKPGREQKAWAKEFTCTGKGNNGGGCGAKLLVEKTDLFRTSTGSYDGSIDYYTTFKCPQCEVLTDISESFADLPHYGDWKKGKRCVT